MKCTALWFTLATVTISRMLFAQDAVVTVVKPIISVTNCVFLSPSTTNAVLVLKVDSVVEQLRKQGDLESLVKKLLASGDVCAVVGHSWMQIPHVTLEYRTDGNYPEHRKCYMCGKTETKEPGVWK